MSSPARGTWIEMRAALARLGVNLSSPARGTWIEMGALKLATKAVSVVPRKGDVDRNPGISGDWYNKSGRPPQGGRG